MERGGKPKVDDAIKETAALLAVAYQRRARIRLIQATPDPLASTEGLAILAQRSVHELTLTSRRKGSLGS
jgi:hypothetical protein